jgi:hypothetical protein
MVIDTTSRIIAVFEESQETELEAVQGSYSRLAEKEGVKRDLARLDLEAQALVNHILDMVEARENSPH